MLIPLRHCWRDTFFCVCVAVDRFVTIGRRTAQFCFGLLMRCLFLGSPPLPRHVAKACENNTQTIMVLLRPSISNRVPRNPAIPLHLQKYCFLVKLRHFSQKKSLQQSHFWGRKHIGFLDSKKWTSPVALKACCLNKTQL